jgi:hypothetical protein
MRTPLFDLMKQARQAGLRLASEEGGGLQIRGSRAHEALVRQLLERKAEVLAVVSVYNGAAPVLDWRKFPISAESRSCILCRHPTLLLDWDRRPCHKRCAEAVIRPADACQDGAA